MISTTTSSDPRPAASAMPRRSVSGPGSRCCRPRPRPAAAARPPRRPRRRSRPAGRPARTRAGRRVTSMPVRAARPAATPPTRRSSGARRSGPLPRGLRTHWRCASRRHGRRRRGQPSSGRGAAMVWPRRPPRLSPGRRPGPATPEPLRSSTSPSSRHGRVAAAIRANPDPAGAAIRVGSGFFPIPAAGRGAARWGHEHTPPQNPDSRPPTTSRAPAPRPAAAVRPSRTGCWPASPPASPATSTWT